ncbi:hypothetical protein GGR51DRAFT_567360 [Nemania sp. FL0031]|nr:hypothetical protein GGR51DRAFT_567360 [Nemania sp. FL0031]
MLRFYSLLLLLLGVLVSMTAAESAPLFCKCTCFKNSTLIQLGPQASCAQCTHAFCLAQNLPICKDAKDAADTNTDVLSTCIQRDSRKDEIIVWAFLLGTAGLLAWAAAKRVNELRQGRKMAAAGNTTAGAAGMGSDVRSRGPYVPVPGSRG